MSGLNGLAAEAVAALLNSLWPAALVAAAAWAAMRYCPRLNAATRHWLWWAVLAVILLLPFAPKRRTPVVPVAVALPVYEMPAPLNTTPPTATPPAPVKPRVARWPLWIAGAWFAMFLLQSGRTAWSYFHVRHLKRRARQAPAVLRRRSFDAWLMSCGVRRPIRLLLSDHARSPMAVGFWHPAVILPAGLVDRLEEPELDHVLLHEIAHLARRDDWTNLAVRMAGAVVGLHPVAGWVLGRIDSEREMACDDWVVSMTGEPRPYAASLTRLFELSSARGRILLASGMAERTSHLGRRIEMLLRGPREFAPRASRVGIAAGVALLAVLAAACSRAPRWIACAQNQAPGRFIYTSSARRVVQIRSALRGSGPVAIVENRRSFLAALVEAGYGDLSVDQIIELKNTGVTPAFLTAMRGSGWGKLAPNDLIVLQRNGVRPEVFRDVHALGFGPYTAQQAVELSRHGVRPELFRALKEAGFTHPDVQEIIQAQTHGLQPHDLREAKQYGGTLTLPQIIRLKQAGVL